MPPDSPDKRLGLPKSQVVEIIERGQEEAIRKLRSAGVPEQRILAAVQQIESACFTALRQQDTFYADLRAFFGQPRDPDHAQHLQERIAFYLKLFDIAVAEIVATAIRNTINEFQHPPVREEPIINLTPAAPGLPEWLDDFLHTTRTVLINAVWLFGLVAGLILSWGGGVPLVWSLFWSGVTVYVTALLWDWVGRSGWSVLIPLIAIGLFCVAVL